MDPIDRIIIDYKRSNQKSVVDEEVHVSMPDGVNSSDDVDVLSITMCDELIAELKKDIEKCRVRAFRCKALDNFFYITTHILSFAVLVIGVYQGAESSEGGNSKWFYTTSVLSGVGALVMEIGKRYNFKARSVLMYDSVQKYEATLLELRELRVSPECGSAKIVKVREMEDRVSVVQLSVFD